MFLVDHRDIASRRFRNNGGDVLQRITQSDRRYSFLILPKPRINQASENIALTYLLYPNILVKGLYQE